MYIVKISDKRDAFQFPKTVYMKPEEFHNWCQAMDKFNEQFRILNTIKIHSCKLVQAKNLTTEDIIAIFDELDEDTYTLSRKATEVWYQYGGRTLLEGVAKKIGILPEQVASMW